MVARPLLLLQLFGVFASFSCGQEEYDFATPVIMALAMLAVVWYQAWCKVLFLFRIIHAPLAFTSPHRPGV